jgi:transcriptional regulator with XRE-family HTH domain
MELNGAFGVTIRKLRQKNGLTQEQLGFEADLRRTFISSLELGQKQPSIQTIYKLSKVFDLTMSKLMGLVEKEMNNSLK